MSLDHASGGGFFAPAPVQTQPTAPTGWQPPAWTPPPTGWQAPAQEEAESGLGIKEALVITGIGLLASLLLQLSERQQRLDQFDHALRKGLVVTLFFYLVLGIALLAYVNVRKVSFVWHRGSPLAAIALGVPVGLTGGTLAVLLNSAIKGHLSGDANVELLVGGGGALRIFVAFAVTAVMAPLVEETLFRGICAGSVLAKGSNAALWVSAIAFAVWHMNPSSLRYYALMGLLLGGLWRKRGMLASMSAHAAFNGVLTLAAVAATTGSASITSYRELSFELPGGWHQTAGRPGLAEYEGPAAVTMAINEQLDVGTPSIDDLLAQLREKEGSLVLPVVPGTESAVEVQGTAAAMADVIIEKQPGHILLIPTSDALYSVVVLTAGSPRGESDWRHLSTSIRVL